MHLPRLQHDGLGERLLLETVVLTKKYAKQHGVFGYMHRLLPGDFTQRRVLRVLRRQKLRSTLHACPRCRRGGDAEEDKMRSRSAWARPRCRLRPRRVPNIELGR